MNNLNKIPGFRTQNKNKVIATILYYTFFIGVMIGLPNMKIILLCGSFIILPFVITEAKDIISIIKNKEFKFTRKIGTNIALIMVIIFSIGTNPIVYKPSSSAGSSSGSSSGGRTVYIASGNSYYHKSSSCKFLNGASTSAVGVNNVGGKHPCNCVKY